MFSFSSVGKTTGAAALALWVALSPAVPAFLVPATALASTVSIQNAAAQTERPILPVIDSSMKDRLRTIYTTSPARQSPDHSGVFIKIGDSITESGSFLVDIGCGDEIFRPQDSGLSATVNFFRGTAFPDSYTSSWCSGNPGGSNAFSRSSAAATMGWTTNDVCGSGCAAGANNPVGQEIRTMRPSIALIMIGTNDIGQDSPLATASLDGYRTRLTALVNQVIAAGVIPVLSTIPPRTDEGGRFSAYVQPYNEIIAQVAADRQIPLWNFWRAIDGLAAHGLEDGVHPSIYLREKGATMTDAGLAYGYNVRNLNAIQILEKVKRIVLDNGAPDAGSSAAPSSTPSSTPAPAPAAPTTTTPAPPASPAPAATVPSTGGVRTVNVYVAGESIERRNNYLQAPFLSTGALNAPADNNDDEYGWSIPLADRVALRTSSLRLNFVGAQGWADYNDDPARGAYPTTKGMTSAISGTSVDSWLEQRHAELEAGTYCYQVAFASRGGNDFDQNATTQGQSDYKNSLKSLIHLLDQGSRCNGTPFAHPIIYVTGHMPDNQGTVAQQRERYVGLAQQVVNELNNSSVASDRAMRVHFVDMWTPFTVNQPTTAFPSPSWMSGSAFNAAKIGRDGDGLHPRRQSSIYAGEIVANALDLNEIASVAAGTPTTVSTQTPPVTSTPAQTPTTATTPTPVTPPAPTTPVASPSPLPATATVGAYNMGSPVLRDLWVDGRNGDDTRTGATRSLALRTITEAWRRIPQGTPLTTGYRVLIAPGTYSGDALPNFYEDLQGSAQYPVIFQAADGRGTVLFQKDINSKGLHYFYLIDVNVVPVPAGDPLHFESADHLLIRGVTASGGANRGAHEGLKVNQSKYVYIEESDFSGADDNSIDFVGVQYGHILNNKIHNSLDWCMYNKGGSAELLVSGNEIYDCGTGGYTAGQGTGFQYMSAPWLHYEAYNIRFVNNVIHDTGTAGLGVNGGYNILMAYNTLYRVGGGITQGSDSHHSDHLFEANHGRRACDNTDEAAICRTNNSAGGWGQATPSEETQYIPNKHVYLYNNLFVNPSGYAVPTILQVAGPTTPPSGVNLTGTQRADTDLQIKGNIFVSAGADLGVGDSDNCADSNPTCNAAQLARDNAINTISAQLVAPAQGDFRAIASTIAGRSPMSIPSFPGGADLPARPLVTLGGLTNSVSADRSGTARMSSVDLVGAYVSGSAGGSVTPTTNPTPATSAPSTPSTNSTSPSSVPNAPSAPAAPGSSGRADLSVSLFATPYPSVAFGQTIAYRVTVMNAGGSAARDVSADVTIPTDGSVVSVEAVSQGACHVEAGRVACAFGQLSSGRSIVYTITYRSTTSGVFAPVATVRSATTDPVSANNRSTVQVTVQPAPTTVNLTGRWLSLTQACRTVNRQQRCTLRGRFQVQNTGTRTAAASHLGIYASTDASLSSDDRSIRTYTIGSIAAGRSRTVSLSVTMPAGVRAGYGLGFVDVKRSIAESNENDNLAAQILP